MEEKKIKSYETKHIRVTWEPHLCRHAAECVKGASDVFNPSIRPWITLREGKEEAKRVAEVIDRCPTRALKYELKKV